MDFKNLFLNNKAVSPVIGVILMVAITVILAAAIGSTVFGEGNAQPAPQANLNIQADGSNYEHVGSLRIEHLGGDPVNFDPDVTKIIVSVNVEDSKEVLDTYQADLGTMYVGSVGKLVLKDHASTANTILINSGDTVNIKIIDKNTNQLICDRDLVF